MMLQNEHSASFFFILLPITKISNDFSGVFLAETCREQLKLFSMSVNVN